MFLMKAIKLTSILYCMSTRTTLTLRILNFYQLLGMFFIYCHQYLCFTSYPFFYYRKHASRYKTSLVFIEQKELLTYLSNESINTLNYRRNLSSIAIRFLSNVSVISYLIFLLSHLLSHVLYEHDIYISI